MASYDENGWLLGSLEPLPQARAYSLLSPQQSSRIDEARWTSQADRFFGAELSLVTQKRYPAGGWPRIDAAQVDLSAPRLFAARLCVITLPLDLAPELAAAAARAARARGGAGFDALVQRGQRLWQIGCAPEDDPRAALLLAAILASLFLAPVLPPEEEDIFGVKGARERFEALARA